MSIVADNPNPQVCLTPTASRGLRKSAPCNLLNPRCRHEQLDAEEIFDLIRYLNDPEHPELTLEQLKVVTIDRVGIELNDRVSVQFTPTIPHCSQATLIGLMIKVKLLKCLPVRYKVSVIVTPDTHDNEDAVNKQLNDKERVAAATENPGVASIVNRGLHGSDRWSDILKYFEDFD